MATLPIGTNRVKDKPEASAVTPEDFTLLDGPGGTRKIHPSAFVSEVEGDVAGLNATILGLQTEITLLKSRVTALEGQIQTVSGTGGIISNATAYTGGLAGSHLDGEPTVDVEVPQIYYMEHFTDGWRQFLLREGIDEELVVAGVPAILRPEDFNQESNAKVFELMF